MTVNPGFLLLNLRIVGLMMAGLAVLNLFVPKRFHWQEEMARLSLLNRQIFQAHSMFLILTLGAVRGAAARLRTRPARTDAAGARDPDRADDLLGRADADAVVLLFAGDLARATGSRRSCTACSR